MALWEIENGDQKKREFIYEGEGNAIECGKGEGKIDKNWKLTADFLEKYQENI